MGPTERAFLDDLEEQAGEVGRRAASKIVDGMPSYRAVGPVPDATIAEIIQQMYCRLVRLWREQRDMDEGELEHARAVSTARAELGIPLADALAAQRISGQVAWETFRDVAARHTDVDRDFVLGATARAFRYLNALGSGVTEAHLEVTQDKEEQRAELERTLIEALLHDPPDLETARPTAHRLQIDLAQTWQVAVVRPTSGGPTSPPVRLLRQLRAELARPGRRILTALGGDGARLLVGGVPLSTVEMDDQLAIGISSPRTALDELAAGHAEASETVTVATRRGGGPLHVDQVWSERFLAGKVQADDLVERFLAPLDDLDEGRRETMAESLQAYLDEECSVTAAARRLYLHPQSFRYRLGKLKVLFGDALEEPRQRLLLHVAVTRHQERQSH